MKKFMVWFAIICGMITIGYTFHELWVDYQRFMACETCKNIRIDPPPYMIF